MILRKKIREGSGKYSVKQTQLANLFSKNVWSDVKTKNGHRKIMNIVSGVVVEYANHAKSVDPGAANGILQAVQKHLNFLCNTIFKYEGNNWKKEPDYQASAKRLYKWQMDLKTKSNG